MSEFLKFAYEFIWQILVNIAAFFVGIFNAFKGIFTSFGDYVAIFKAYTQGFNPFQWMLSILLVLVVALIFLLVFYKLFLLLRKYIRHRKTMVSEDDLLEEISVLNQQVADLVDEKSKIMAMKVSQLGLTPEGQPATTQEEESEGKKEKHPQRFAKLALVDELYAQPVERVFDDQITLEQLADRYRAFAASRLHLYYDLRTIRLYLAGMASTKILILEGISGTGKTSLPYSFSKFLNTQAGMVSVQPSYRDRTELLGYFNEFTKRFNETEFLRNVYAASYQENPCFIVLDEMNLARIEYYFAEMLSVLEMPTPEEWTIDLVPVGWESDPLKMKDGKLQVPTNLWFVGTANNDDSTFTITDKVYDRAIPIELNQRAEPFTAEDTDPVDLSWTHLSELYDKARAKFPITEASRTRLAKLDGYLVTRFKMAFGNRIMKQMGDFVPVYTACGGTEMDAMDYIIERKILKKFESLNISFARDEIKELILFIEKTFGKNGLVSSKRYLQKLQTMF